MYSNNSLFKYTSSNEPMENCVAPGLTFIFSPGVGRNTFLSNPHLCFIIDFICDLFVSRDDPLMS